MFASIEPLDPVFFRDGRPFTMGEDDWSGSLFPPPPGVIYGALRSLYFSYHPRELPLANTEHDPTGGLSLKLVCWLVGEDASAMPCFPVPLDCVQAEGRGLSYRLRRLSGPERVLSDHPLPLVLKQPLGVRETSKPADGCLLDDAGLVDYLRGAGEEFPALPMERYVLAEYKVGIGLDRGARVAAEHKLYRIRMRRLRDIKLAVKYEGLELPDSGLVRLGGEGRAALLTSLRDDLFEAARVWTSGSPPSRFFKLYLATPAFFSNGWLPGWLGAGDVTGSYGGCMLRLLAAAVGRYQPVGGFSMGPPRAEPKQMRRAVPAGSVYYFEVLKGGMEDIVQAFHGLSVSEYRSNEGFGIAFVGLPSEASLAVLRQYSQESGG